MDYTVLTLPAEKADVLVLANVMHESIHALARQHYSKAQLVAWSPAPRTEDEAKKRFAGQTVFQAMDDEGWGGRIRTCECRYQKPVPYHLATPQRGAQSRAGGGGLQPRPTGRGDRFFSCISPLAPPGAGGYTAPSNGVPERCGAPLHGGGETSPLADRSERSSAW